MNQKNFEELPADTFNEDNHAVEDEAASLKYFDEQVIDSQKYWSRLGGQPDFAGKVVLELGCGHGALSIDAAKSGAQRVIGLDLIGSRIGFANKIVADRFPDIADKIEFHKLDIADIDLDGKVDVVISKDTFEHIMGIDRVLLSVKRVLRKGGLLITGFSPLYYSPFGDHGFHAIGQPIKLPWAHLMLGDARVVAAYNKYHPGIQCQTIYDCGLNKLKRSEFLQAFDKAGLTVVSEKINATQGASKLMPVLKVLNQIPGLQDYTTVNMYAILRKN
jgi:SAM-dependent methyltransferase